MRASADDTAAGALATETLAAINGQSPRDFGAATVDGLEYADPTEALTIVDPPEPNSDGSVDLSYPLGLPPGHGITPDLNLQYGSGGDNGWMGLGWDLSVGEVTIDTTFGAPHFSEASESESYQLDGALLTPNANDDQWEARVVGDRRDFTRQVETEYDEIIRHQVGDSWPADYFWEVRSKDGSVKWYGGTPDSGGPVPSTAPGDVPTIDEGAVVRNDAGHIVTWLLSAHRDIGVNLIRYEYETIHYGFAEGAWVEKNVVCDPGAELCGRHTYLDRILYTDATSAITDSNGPPYEIDFLRESEMPLRAADKRADPVVDAGLGYVDVVVDRLARVEVKHGAPAAPGADRVYATTPPAIAARYEFTYQTGRFGKTLVSSIIQGVNDPHVHSVEYYDELTGGSATSVPGFAAPEDWATGEDVDAELYLSADTDVSALGGSETNAGSGNIYVGFNPISPSKTFSFGVGIELSGGDTEAISEWIDLNGDNLPDKVFLDGSTVRFRMNNTGPGGAGDWASATETANLPAVPGIDELSQNSNFGFQISAEAYPLVAIGLGTGLAFSWGSSYFSDVNGDGLVDFVSGGQVHFNNLNAEGIPTFSTSSANTPIPLDPSALPEITSDALDELSATMALQSPPIDTVRRFIVPFTGTISILAPATLDNNKSMDGVRLAIQHNGSELHTATVAPATPTAFPTALPAVAVNAGDRIYFRAGATADGTSDSVTWSPVITYVSPAWSDTDANGLSEVEYSAADDFTLAGRPDAFIAMPNTGVATVDATVEIAEALTDAVTVRAIKRQITRDDDPDTADVVTDTPIDIGTIAAGTAPGTVSFTGDVDVAVTSASDGNVNADMLSVYLAVDSPVDLADIEFSAKITYDSAVDADGAAIPESDVAKILDYAVLPHIEIYPHAHPSAPSQKAALPGGSDVMVSVKALGGGASGISSVDAIVTLKSDTAQLAKVTATLPVVGDTASGTIQIPAIADDPSTKWVDVMIRDDAFGRNGLELTQFALQATPTAPIANVTLRWSGTQGVFPQPYRGWAIAGYTAGGDLRTAAIDESAFVIDPSSYPQTEPTRDDASLDEAHAERSYAFVPALAPGTPEQPVLTDRWVGPRPNIYGDATTISTSLLAVDSVDFANLATGAAAGDGGRSAPTRMGVSGPGLTLSFGIGPLGASAGISPSTGLTDFEDLNGDGYPDVIASGQVTYTNQLGTYLDPTSIGRASVTNQDLTFSVNGGLSSGMVDIVPNTKGSANAVSGDSAGKGAAASDAGPSFSLGISGSGGYSWTSPNTSSFDGGAELSILADGFVAEDGEIQRAFADINGDGLADSVYTSDDGVFAYYNLGYGFTEHAVPLATGGFESRESATGGAGAGFSLPYAEFGGGVNLLWNYDWSKYSWRDVNGDGILDQLHQVSDTEITVEFGTGSGLLDPIDYGNFANVPGIAGGEQISFDQSNGVGGGVSATIYIGPLCLAACYLVIGAGGGYNNSRSSSSADVEDVNGDGYADSLMSLNDDKLSVSLNQQGRTNLLKQVTNPLGGSFSLEYERDGNTTDHPDSIWVMSRVDIHDGRSTTGHYASTFEYGGLDYDRTHRSSLGYDTVTTTELDTANAHEPLRFTEQTFLNDNVFVKGLLTTATMLEPGDGGERVQVRGSAVEWGFRDVRVLGGDVRDAVTPRDADALGVVDTVASRGRSIAPLIVRHDEFWFEGEDDTTFEKATEYVYDGLGNVLVESDLGAPDDPNDDLRTTIEYSDCDTATINGCLPASTPQQPLWSVGTCVNWASFPTKVSVEGVADGAPVLLRERVSEIQMCDNGAATKLEELVSIDDGGTKTYATSDLTLNQYGDYRLVMAPPGADGVRYTVRYTYDADRNSDIAKVEEFDVEAGDAAADVLANGLQPSNSTPGIASSATFDPLSGRADSRTDANGVTRRYVFDEHGRIVSTSTMGTAAVSSTTLIEYEYHANDPEYGYAIASHFDAFDGNNPAGTDDAAGDDTTPTIDTITFVDGLGRVRQTKRDARLSVEGAAPTNTRQVTDGVDFDALARPVVLYGATADVGPATTFSPAAVNGAQTVTEWFSYDLPYTVTQPGDRTTTYDYPWEAIGDSPLLAWTVATDPDGRVTTLAQDVRDVTRFHIDEAAPRVDAAGLPVVEDPLLTEYVVNSLGELLRVVDSTGAVTSYEYDLLGQNLSVTTPNGGTVRNTYDLARNKRSTVNDAMAAIGEETTYEYDFNRLTEIDHPGTVDDITYVYGMDNSDGRFTAGRIRHIEDRTRLVDNTYDRTGAMIEQTAVIKRHNWRPTMTAEQLASFTYSTAWSYDELGRIASVGYPDSKTVSFVPDGVSVGSLTSAADLTTLLNSADLEGETVSYQYDSGGLLKTARGAEEGIQFVTEQITADPVTFQPRTVQVPRRVTHSYAYLNDRVYEPRLLPVREEMGNGTVSEYSFDPDTRWLETKKTTAPNPDPTIAARLEIQDLSYTYDVVGRPLTYDNDLPLANRAINGGDAAQKYSYDGFGRLRGANGTFDLKAGEQQQYSYGVKFEPEAPWSVVEKTQNDALVTSRGKPSTKVNDLLTYSFERTLGTPGGPLQVASDLMNDSRDVTKSYAFDYNANGAINSMLAGKNAAPATTSTTIPKKGGSAPTPAPSETNVWDRTFTWTLMNQLTSASDGSELRTFAYDDTGALMIQDGNLLSRDGAVLHQSGGGPETIFLNSWVTVRSQKIYKHTLDGIDKLVTKMDSGAGFEDKQMFSHTDVIGSTNIVTDNQGRGFQRHEYFPSGEIWISDQKEEIRTPFQFADGYYEDEFDLVLFGARWYDVQRELFLSPDPLLSADVRALIDQPALGGAYTYAGANPAGNVDHHGLRFFTAQQANDVKARAQAAFDAEQITLKDSGEGDRAQVKADRRAKLESAQERAETVLEPNAILTIDLHEGKVKLGLPYGPRKTWKMNGGNEGSQAAPPEGEPDAQGDNSPSAEDSADATNGGGGPSVAGSGDDPASDRAKATDSNGAASNDSGEGADDQQSRPSVDQQGAAGADDSRGDK